jgi:hypothetical protein
MACQQEVTRASILQLFHSPPLHFLTVPCSSIPVQHVCLLSYFFIPSRSNKVSLPSFVLHQTPKCLTSSFLYSTPMPAFFLSLFYSNACLLFSLFYSNACLLPFSILLQCLPSFFIFFSNARLLPILLPCLPFFVLYSTPMPVPSSSTTCLPSFLLQPSQCLLSLSIYPTPSCLTYLPCRSNFPAFYLTLPCFLLQPILMPAFFLNSILLYCACLLSYSHYNACLLSK